MYQTNGIMNLSQNKLVVFLDMLFLLIDEYDTHCQIAYGRRINKQEIEDTIQDVINYYDELDLREEFHFDTSEYARGHIMYCVIGKTDKAIEAMKEYKAFLLDMGEV